jgi:hypothetical protein
MASSKLNLIKLTALIKLVVSKPRLLINIPDVSSTKPFTSIYAGQDCGLGIELGLILKNPLVAFFALTCIKA